MKSDQTHELVKQAYGQVARNASSCCPPRSTCGCSSKVKGMAVPEAELGLSCGNPVAFSHLRVGDVVVDLGSGAGRDVFMAAQQVGNTGKAVGVDMTDEMLALAGRNAAKFTQRTGLSNVEFRKGHIEELPVEDGSADVVISNCVINLSPDKPRVFREVYRVLRAGGKMVVSDIVLNRPLPDQLKDDEDLYTSCIAGALRREEYLQAIRAAGFAKIEILTDITYQAAKAENDPITGQVGGALEGVASSITVLAVR